MNPSIPRAHSLNVFLTPLLVQSATKKELWTIRSSTRSLSSNWLKRTSVKSMNATRTKRRYKDHLKKMQSWELHWSMRLSQWTCPLTSGANTWMRNCQSSRMEKDTTTSRIYKKLSSKDLKHHLQSRSSILFLTTCSGILRDQLARTSNSCWTGITLLVLCTMQISSTFAPTKNGCTNARLTIWSRLQCPCIETIEDVWFIGLKCLLFKYYITLIIILNNLFHSAIPNQSKSMSATVILNVDIVTGSIVDAPVNLLIIKLINHFWI